MALLLKFPGQFHVAQDVLRQSIEIRDVPDNQGRMACVVQSQTCYFWILLFFVMMGSLCLGLIQGLTFCFDGGPVVLIEDKLEAICMVGDNGH